MPAKLKSHTITKIMRVEYCGKRCGKKCDAFHEGALYSEYYDFCLLYGRRMTDRKRCHPCINNYGE